MPELDALPLGPVVWNADDMGAGCIGQAAWVTHTASLGYLHLATGGTETADDLESKLAEIGGEVVGTYRSGAFAALIRVHGALMLVRQSSWDMSVSVNVSADVAARAGGELERVLGIFEPLRLNHDASIYATYWFASAFGPSTFRGALPRVPWSALRGNYAGPVGEAVDKLVAMQSPDADSGKVVLVHGPPGTGKSRMLAALANEWSEWADLHVISDPAQFFEDRSYLLSVAEATAMGDRWAVMVLEDADKFIDKRQLRGAQQGDGINALLNMADGMLGTAMNVIFVLTTNVDMDEFDSALIRPGRGLANIHVPSLSQTEAQAWLAARGSDLTVGEEGASLATLYDMIRPQEQSIIVASGGAVEPVPTTVIPKVTRVVSRARFTADPTNAPILASGGDNVVPITRYPVEPPADWFAQREYDEPTPKQITADGQIFGHVWLWGTYHIGANGRKIMPPRSATGYAEYLNKQVLCEDGSMVWTGPVYLNCDHADLHLSGVAARDAMAHTGTAWGDVVVYEDRWGGQIAGRVRPHMSNAAVAIARGSDVSPDWRPVRRGHEMYGMISVNTSGFIVPRPIVASGEEVLMPAVDRGPRIGWDHERDEPLAIVAVGMLRQNPPVMPSSLSNELDGLSPAEMHELRNLLATRRADRAMARFAQSRTGSSLNERAAAVIQRLG